MKLQPHFLRLLPVQLRDHLLLPVQPVCLRQLRYLPLHLRAPAYPPALRSARQAPAPRVKVPAHPCRRPVVVAHPEARQRRYPHLQALRPPYLPARLFHPQLLAQHLSAHRLVSVRQHPLAQVYPRVSPPPPVQPAGDRLKFGMELVGSINLLKFGMELVGFNIWHLKDLYHQEQWSVTVVTALMRGVIQAMLQLVMIAELRLVPQQRLLNI